MIKENDKIAFVSPSGWIKKEDLKNALNWFEKHNIQVAFGRHVFDISGYEAGTSKDRAFDINAAFEDNQVKAVFCTRGGAGSLKILDWLDYELIKHNPKPLFGLSDSTALQNALYTKSGIASYTGFLPIYDFKKPEPEPILEKSLTDIFEGKKIKYFGYDIIKDGEVEGVLVGGCLSVFASLCGTDYFPNLEDKILLLEDVNEKTYRIDLMLEQLRLQKGFDAVKGIIFGKFLNCQESDAGDGSIEDILQNFAYKVNKPTVYNFNYGHIKNRVLMPIGKKVRLKTSSSTVEEVD